MIDVKTVTNCNVDIQSLLKGTNTPIETSQRHLCLKCYLLQHSSVGIRSFTVCINLDSRNQNFTASVDYTTRHALVLYIVQGYIIYWRSRDSNPTHFGFVEGGTDKRFLTDDFTHFVYTPTLRLGLEPRTYGLTCYR